MGILYRLVKDIIGNRLVEIDQLHPMGLFEKLNAFIVDMLCYNHLFAHDSI